MQPETDRSSSQWDVFISYAHEDKETVARPLAHLLNSRYDLRVWFDEFELKIGDSIAEAIDRGLRRSRRGVVIISKFSMGKKWPQNELRALFALESASESRILPIWHNVGQDDVNAFSALLVDRIALDTRIGLDEIAWRISMTVGTPRRALFKDEVPDGVLGVWIGLSGRLRMEPDDGALVGYYDWFGKAWAGSIHGSFSEEVLRFKWNWTVNESSGSGFFVRTTLQTRLWPAYHLIGGWTYGDVDNVREDLITDTKIHLTDRNSAYDDRPHRMVPPGMYETPFKPWAFSFGRIP